MVAEFESYVKLNKKISPEVVSAVNQIDDYSKLADTIASHLAVKLPTSRRSWKCARSPSASRSASP